MSIKSLDDINIGLKEFQRSINSMFTEVGYSTSTFERDGICNYTISLMADGLVLTDMAFKAAIIAYIAHRIDNNLFNFIRPEGDNTKLFKKISWRLIWRIDPYIQELQSTEQITYHDRYIAKCRLSVHPIAVEED